ncbi:MAG: sigma-70 family RNA polymerase sigma factor, partial [Comamonadaceae bacterium]
MGAAISVAEATPAHRDVPAGIAELLDRVKHRDPAALRELYVAYSRRVHSYALQVLRDDHAAQDVVQDVFIRVWRYAGSYDASKTVKPEAWLFQMTRNVALNEVVQRSRMVHGDADETADHA